MKTYTNIKTIKVEFYNDKLQSLFELSQECWPIMIDKRGKIQGKNIKNIKCENDILTIICCDNNNICVNNNYILFNTTYQKTDKLETWSLWLFGFILIYKHKQSYTNLDTVLDMNMNMNPELDYRIENSQIENIIISNQCNLQIDADLISNEQFTANVSGKSVLSIQTTKKKTLNSINLKIDKSSSFQSNLSTLKLDAKAYYASKIIFGTVYLYATLDAYYESTIIFSKDSGANASQICYYDSHIINLLND